MLHYIVWYPLFIVNAIYSQYDIIHAHLGSYHNFGPPSHICKVVIAVVKHKIPVAFLVQFQRTSHIFVLLILQPLLTAVGTKDPAFKETECVLPE